MLKCGFNKVALQLYWNRISAWVSSCKFPAYFQNTFSYEHFWMAASNNEYLNIPCNHLFVPPLVFSGDFILFIYLFFISNWITCSVFKELKGIWGIKSTCYNPNSLRLNFQNLKISEASWMAQIEKPFLGRFFRYLLYKNREYFSLLRFI